MRNLLTKTVQLLFRVWFYLWVAIPIFVFAPLLLIFAGSEKRYPQFYWCARNLWALPILYACGCPPRIRYAQKLERGKSYMLVANHTSMLDIMLMLRVSKTPFVFVGKKELVKIPVFGYFYKRVCIMVDRSSVRSRTAVYKRAQRRLDQGLGICIFPEGGVPEPHIVLDRFKDGAFKMAIDHQIPVVPMTFYDSKKRLPFELTHGGPGKLRAQVHCFVNPPQPDQNGLEAFREGIRNTILEGLV